MRASAISEYVGLQDAVSDRAMAALEAISDRIADLPADAQRDVLLQITPAIADTYGDAAAELAATWYDQARTADLGPSAYQASAVSTDSAARVTGEIRAQAGLLYGRDGSIDALMEHIRPMLDMIVRDAARNTVMDNISRDPAHPGWARYAEANACAWCIMIASQGGIYESKRAAVTTKAGERFHYGCRCVPVPVFDTMPAIVRDRIAECAAAYEAARDQLPAHARDTDDILRIMRKATDGH